MTTSSDIEKLQKKSAQGDSDSQNKLGIMYYHGEGILQDHEEAFAFFEKSSSQGNTEAQYNLNIMNEEYKRVELFKKEIKKGNDSVKYHLGMMYYYGRGVYKNIEEASKLIKEAKDSGEIMAANHAIENIFILMK